MKYDKLYKILLYSLYIYPSIILPFIVYFKYNVILKNFILYIFLHSLSIFISYWDILIYNKKYYIDNKKLNLCDEDIHRLERANSDNTTICNCNSCNDCNCRGSGGNDDGCFLFILILLVVWIPLIIFIGGKEWLITRILKKTRPLDGTSKEE
jgi:hypothetical protein